MKKKLTDRILFWGVVFLLASMTIMALGPIISMYYYWPILEIAAPVFGREHLPILHLTPIVDYTHRISGVTLSFVGAAQFLGQILLWPRSVHRWLGWAYVLLVVIVVGSGFALLFLHPPFGGPNEFYPTLFFGTMLPFTTFMSIRSIKRDDVRLHREWMIRSYSIVLGPGLVRFDYMALWRALELPERSVMTTSFWIGWILSMGVAEWRIRATRR